jgi:hypothetical protein
MAVLMLRANGDRRCVFPGCEASQPLRLGGKQKAAPDLIIFFAARPRAGIRLRNMSIGWVNQSSLARLIAWRSAQDGLEPQMDGL